MCTYEFTLFMTSSTKIARLASMGCHSDSTSSFERKRGSGRASAVLMSLGRSRGRKSGAVWRISFLNFSRGPRRVCIRPLSSGEPATMFSMDRTNVPINCIISTTGSEVGGFGRSEISSFNCASSLSSSPCSSGSLPTNWNQPQKFDVLKLTAWKSSLIERCLDVVLAYLCPNAACKAILGSTTVPWSKRSRLPSPWLAHR